MWHSIGILHFVIVSAIIFTIGLFGVFMNRKSIISILMSVELILIAININFVAFSTYLRDMNGQIFTRLVLAVAAAETAVGLAILVSYYRNKGNITVEEINELKG